MNTPELESFGLRERKKAKAKARIQECALKLFAKQGYTETTVEQIAAAAEVSPSTFFRYFKTKEAVALYDSTDPLIVAIFREQPKELTIIQALRRAVKESYAKMPDERLALEQERFKVIRTIPELRTTMFDEMIRNIDMFAELIAERTGRSTSDIQVRNLAGAVIGVGMASLLQAYKQPSMDRDSLNFFDTALAELEKGLLL